MSYIQNKKYVQKNNLTRLFVIQFDTIVNKCLVGRTNPTQIHKIQIDFPVDTDQDLLRVLNRLVECFLEPRRHDNNGVLSPILAFAIPRLAAKMKLSFFNSLAAVPSKETTFDDIINDVIEGSPKLTSRNLHYFHRFFLPPSTSGDSVCHA